MNITELVTVLPIVIICYAVGLGFKALKNINDACIPVLLALLGGILGVVSMYVMSGYPANDVITAFAVGVISGLASTGSYELVGNIKELFTKGKDDSNAD